jgi:excisionase family DNA binding protein
MRRATSAQRTDVDVLGRPPTGREEPGVPGSSVSPAEARLLAVTSLHQLIDTLAAFPGFNASAPERPDPLLLDAKEAAKLLSLSRAKVCDMANHGEIPSIRVGRSLRIPREPLIAWVNDRTSERDWLKARKLPAWSRNDRSLER